MPSDAALQEFASLTSRPQKTLGASTSRSLSPTENPHKSIRSSTRRSPPISSNTTNYRIPRQTFDANTGPKGVIADAQAYEKARREVKRRTFNFFSSNQHVQPTQEVSEKKSRFLRRDRTTSRSTTPESVTSTSEKRDSTSETDEDEFMRAWREERMRQLSDQAVSEKERKRTYSPTKRSWGRLETVDADGYLDAVERTRGDTNVVVLIHDFDSALSSALSDSLSTLSRKYTTTRFIRLSHVEAEMDELAVPAVLVYRGGELVQNLTSFLDLIPEGRDVSVVSAEEVLGSRGVF